MEQHHQVERRPDPADRRRNIVSLTGAGQRHLEELQRYADTVQDDLPTGLDPRERRQLQALLAKVLGGHQPQPA